MNRRSQSTAVAKRLVQQVVVCLGCAGGGGLLAFLLPSAFLPIVALVFLMCLLFATFVLYFFRDPDAEVPEAFDAIVAPAHGRVDIVDEAEEPEFMKGICRRISIFLSVFDVHVQNAPISGRVTLVRHRQGRFVSALRTESAGHNENQLIGIESTKVPGERVAVRQIAGFIARRVAAWVKEGDRLVRGQRLGMIHFGSRCDLYLPPSITIAVQVGDKVVGGETVVARRVGSANCSEQNRALDHHSTLGVSEKLPRSKTLHTSL